MANKRSAADSTGADTSTLTPRKGDKTIHGKDARGNNIDRGRSKNKKQQSNEIVDPQANDASTQLTSGRTRSQTKANRVTLGGNTDAAPPDKLPHPPKRSPNAKKNRQKLSKKEKTRAKIRKCLEEKSTRATRATRAKTTPSDMVTLPTAPLSTTRTVPMKTTSSRSTQTIKTWRTKIFAEQKRRSDGWNYNFKNSNRSENWRKTFI